MPSVAGNDRYLQRQINRANVAPLGPIILSAGDRIRLLDVNGNTVLDIKPSGALIRQNGAMVALDAELEAKSTTVYVDGKVTSLLGSIATKASNSRVDSLQTQINTNDGYRIAGDQALDGRMDSVESGVSTLNGEMDAVQSGISTLNGQMANRATTAQINYVIGVINTALNNLGQRVNHLESLADGVSEGQSTYVIPTL